MKRTTMDAATQAARDAARSVARRLPGAADRASEERCTTLERQRDRAREQLAAARRQLDVLRQQRDGGRYATRALTAVAASLGAELGPSGHAGHLPRVVGRLRADAALTDGLLGGNGLQESAVRTVRGLLAESSTIARARALCTALAEEPALQDAAAVGVGLYLMDWGSRADAHAAFTRASTDLVVRTAAVEAVTTALRVDVAAAERLVPQILAHPDLGPADAFAIAGALTGAHELPLARRALDRAQEANLTDELLARNMARLREWLDRAPAELDTVVPPRPRPVIGLMHYDHPHYERASSNLGDYTQTLAMLGHVLRRRGLTLHTDDVELGRALDLLRTGIAPDLQLDVQPVEADLVPVTRDASRSEALPRPTWLIAFGWHMYPVFGMRTDLPYHAAVRPVFVSFHVRRPDVLTPEGVDYLRRHAPIGCRDWSTADLLMSHGIDAFFSGCLTTTTHLSAGRRGEPDPDVPLPVGRIDVVGDRSRDALTQITTDINDRGLAANLMAAHERNLQLRDGFGELHTSRLHVYLPATSMGVPVTFEPLNRADIRFDGLDGLTPGSSELRAMQERISDLMDLVLGLVTSGATEQQVYAAWRERTAPLVAQARARRDRWRNTFPPVETLAGAGEPVRRTAVHLGEGGDVHVALALDQNLVDVAPIVLEGIDDHTARDVRVHLLTRQVPNSTVEAWARTFPRLRFSHYRFDEVDHGSITRLLAHTTVSTMDRLLLPDVLRDLDRVVYLDIDVAVLGDVGELWDTDLRGAPLAARTTPSDAATSAYALIKRAGMKLPVDVAREFRAFMHARMEGDFVPFNAGVLVLDLARMRADGFTEHWAGTAGRYGLNDQDVLCFYGGPTALPLDRRWNTLPTREAVPADARLVHYAGGAKPWASLPLPAKDLWLAARERWLARTGDRLEPVRGTTFSGNYAVEPDTPDDRTGQQRMDDMTPAWSRT